MSNLPNDAPSPRLCIIVKWPDFEGYGFNLHAEKSKPGQYIGKVDENSPAETAGLLEDDRIIEVNGVNIANENHKQVVQRIKAVPNETRLLVLDPSADKYYKNKNIVVRGTQDNVVVRSSVREETTTLTSPPPPPPPAVTTATAIPTTTTEAHSEGVSNGRHDEPDNRSVSSHASSSATSEASTQPQHASTVPEGDKDTTVVEDLTTTTTTPQPQPHDHNTMENDDNNCGGGGGGGGGVTLIINTEESGTQGVTEEEEEVVATSMVEVDVDKNEENEERETSDTQPAEGHEEVCSDEGECKAKEEVEGGTENEASEAVVTEALTEEVTTTTASSPPDQESDLEAEYDNVDIDLGPQRESQTTTDSPPRRLSVSSNTSSQDASDTPCTDTPTTTTTTTTTTNDQTPMSTSPTPPPSLDPAPLGTTASPPSNDTTTTTTTTTNNATPPSQPVPNKNTYNTSGLNLNMSAAEMRAMLARKKKADPRKETVDLKTKYQIIQNM